MLREGLVAAGGEGIALGILLSVWLAASAFGARLARLGFIAKQSFAFAPLLFALLVALGIFCWRIGSPLVGGLPGEHLGLYALLCQAAICLGPTSLFQGLWFARIMESQTGHPSRARSLVYWETMGCLLLGLLLAWGPTLKLYPSGQDSFDTRQARYSVSKESGEEYLNVNGKRAWQLLGKPYPSLTTLASWKMSLEQLSPDSRVIVAGEYDIARELDLTHLRVGYLIPELELAQYLVPGVHSGFIRKGTFRRHASARPQNAPPFSLAILGDVTPLDLSSGRQTTLEAFRYYRRNAHHLLFRLSGVDFVPESTGMRMAGLVMASARRAGYHVTLLPDGHVLASRPEEAIPFSVFQKHWPAPIELGQFVQIQKLARGPLTTKDAEDPLASLLNTEKDETAFSSLPFRWTDHHRDPRPSASLHARTLAQAHSYGGASSLFEKFAAWGNERGFIYSFVFVLFVFVCLALLYSTTEGTPSFVGFRLFHLLGRSWICAVGLVLLFDVYQVSTSSLHGDFPWLSALSLAGFALGNKRQKLFRNAGVSLWMLCGIALFSTTFPFVQHIALVGISASSAFLLGWLPGRPLGELLASGGVPASRVWALDLMAAAVGAWMAGVWIVPWLGWWKSLMLLGLAFVVFELTFLSAGFLEKRRTDAPAVV